MNKPGTSKLTVEHSPVTMERLPFRRIIQERGELALIEDGGVFNHLACFTLKPGPGLFRGGHVHQAKVEHFYILSGKGVLKWVDVQSGGKGSVILTQGDRVTIKPGLAHRFEALEHLIVVEYYAGVHDPSDDIPNLTFE